MSMGKNSELAALGRGILEPTHKSPLFLLLAHFQKECLGKGEVSRRAPH